MGVPLAVRLSRRAEDIASAETPGAAQAVSAPPPEALAAALAALERGETHYTDRPGIARLRAAVARALANRHGLTLGADEVVITCGDTEARFVAVQQLLPIGGSLVAVGEAPASLPGAVRLRDGRLLTESEAGAAPAADVLHLDSRVPRERAARWLAPDAAPACIVYDTTFAPDAAFHPAELGLGPRTVTIGGLGYDRGLESWRVGFLAAPGEGVAALRSFKQALTICTTNLSQWAALALFEEEA